MEGTFHSPPRTCAWSWSRWFGFGNTQGWAEAGRLQSKGKCFGHQRGGKACDMRASQWFRTSTGERGEVLVRGGGCLSVKKGGSASHPFILTKSIDWQHGFFPWSLSHRGYFPVSAVCLALHDRAGNVQDAWISLRIYWTDLGTCTGDGGPEEGKDELRLKELLC